MNELAVLPIPDRSADSIVGGNVRYLMDDRGVEQLALARRLGVDQSTLSLKLHGKRKWTVAELVNVSDIFGVSIDALARRRELEPIPHRGALPQSLGGPSAESTLSTVGSAGFEPTTSSV